MGEGEDGQKRDKGRTQRRKRKGANIQALAFPLNIYSPDGTHKWTKTF